MKTLSTIFKITDWNESSFSEVDGAGKLTKASITRTFTGDIEGDSKLEYLMAYNADGSASYTGFERITGRLLERSGSFVIRHEGIFKDGIADTHCTIVSNSGTEGLTGLSGTGRFRVGHGMEHPMIFDVELV